MLLGGAVIPATVADNGGLPQVRTTQTAKAASTTDDDQAQTISYQVFKSGTTNSSAASQYFTDKATVTPNGDGTYTVVLTVTVPSVLGMQVGVNVKTMGNATVTDSAIYNKDGKNYKDLTFKINKLSDLDGTLSSDMEIKPGIIPAMSVAADFKFDTSNLKDVTTDNSSSDTNSDTDTNNDSATSDDSATTTDPDSTTDGNTSSNFADDPLLNNALGNGSTNNSGSNVIVGTPVTTDSDSSTATEQDIPYQVLKADASQGESVSTQYFTGTAKVTKNDDGTYDVLMTMQYPTSFGDKPVTINSINGGWINPNDTKYYSQGDQNMMDFGFTINSLSDLDSLVPCAMTIDVPNLFNSDESVNFKFNATSSGVAGTSAVGTSGTATNPSGVYGSTSDWPSTGSSTTGSDADPSTTNSTLPQTSNSTNQVILTVIGVAVASMSAVLFKRFYEVEKEN